MAPKTADFVVRFKNIPPGAEADYRFALAGADVLVVAESHTRDAREFVDPKIWGTIHEHGGRRGRIAIHWRLKTARLVRSNLALLNKGNGLDFPGAERWAQVARFQHLLTGRYVNLEGDHFVPHADDAKRPGAITPLPRGAKAVIPAIQSIRKRWVKNLAGIDILVGDYNIDLDADLRHKSANDMLERVNAFGFRSDVQLLGPVQDTHGHNEYDWILLRLWGPIRNWTRGNAVAWVKSHGTGPKRKSDHRDRWVRIRITVRRGWKVPAGSR